jgi:hypothetical protein
LAFAAAFLNADKGLVRSGHEVSLWRRQVSIAPQQIGRAFDR